MKIDFLSIKLDGFKGFVGKPQRLKLNQGPGLLFLRGRNEAEPSLGSNGAGKSTLWDALCWCLYGQTASKLKNTDITPWAKKQKTTVTLTLRVDGKKHTLVRKANPNSLKLDDKNVATEVVERLIGLSYDLFVNTVLLAQGQPLFLDRSPKDKMQLFSDVLDLERWDRCSEAASAKIARLSDEESTLTAARAGAETGIQQLTALIAETQVQSDAWEQHRQKQLAIASTDLEAKEKKLEELNNEFLRVDGLYDMARTEWNLLRKDEIRLQGDVLAAERQVVVLDAKLGERQVLIERATKQLHNLGETNVCPTCGQKVKAKDLDKHRSELTSQLARLSREASGLRDELKKEEAAHKKKLKAFEKVQKAVAELNKKSSDLADEKERINIPLARLAVEVTTAKAAREESETIENPHRAQIKKLKKRLSESKIGLKDLNKELAVIERRIRRNRFWVTGFRDVKLYIIEEVLQELELATNAMLPQVGLRGWAINYQIERETKSGTTQRGLNVAIISPSNTETVRWESWSGGEGQRLRMVGALALSEVLLSYAGVESSFEVLDEPTRHLSAEGVRDMCDFLSDRATRLGMATWYVDHATLESSKFAAVTTVVKTKNGSIIEQGDDG